MQKTSRFSRLLTLVTAVALAVCLPVSAYAETETTEEAAAPAVVEEAAQDNTADEAASEDSASCVRVVEVTIFMDTTKGHFESDPDNVALNYLNRAEFEETPITLPTVIANEGWEFKGWDVWGKEHFVLGADATELGTSGLGALAGVLSALKVDALICGGIGGGAQIALSDAGIRLYGGVSGSADVAAEALVAGELDFNPNVRCAHHDHHGEGHSCGSHGCDHHSCG